MKIRTSANGMIYWGTSPLPAGSTCLGTVEMAGRVGALIKASDGSYHFGKRGKLDGGIAKESVEKALNKSAIYAEAGKATSEKKAAAVRENGRRGGRPKGSKDTKPREKRAKDV